MNAAAEEGVEIKTKLSRNFAKISRSLKNRDIFHSMYRKTFPKALSPRGIYRL
jgi:hypothetical protein